MVTEGGLWSELALSPSSLALANFLQCRFKEGIL